VTSVLLICGNYTDSVSDPHSLCADPDQVFMTRSETLIPTTDLCAQTLKNHTDDITKSVPLKQRTPPRYKITSIIIEHVITGTGNPHIETKTTYLKFCSVSRLVTIGNQFYRSCHQCCGSGRFLTGSGSDFRKRPDPDPDPNKFSANFFLKFF
jgi:hypothetical protein